MIRIGILGCAEIAFRRFLPALMENKEFECVCIAEEYDKSKLEQFEKEFGIKSAENFQAIIEDRNAPKVEKSIDGYSGFLFYDDNGMPLVAMHWQHRFNHMVGRYNDIYRVQMPNITPHGRVIIRTS